MVRPGIKTVLLLEGLLCSEAYFVDITRNHRGACMSTAKAMPLRWSPPSGRRCYTLFSSERDFIPTKESNDDFEGDDDVLLDDFKILSEGVQQKIDLAREETRMESLEAYVLVSVLTATASVTTINEIQGVLEESSSLTRQILYESSIMVSTLCALSGIYATIIFSMSILYGKTALGMRRDNIYEYFLGVTGEVRIRGFRAFSASLVLFMVELSLVASERLDDESGLIFLAAMLCCTLYVLKDWKSVVDKATPIFLNKIPEDFIS